MGRLPAHQRGRETIEDEYSKAWDESNYAEYDLEHPPVRLSPWEWRGEHMLASDVGATRVRQLLLSRIIERVQPRSVLEVGSGNGINLIMLAGSFPDVAFTGVELTQQGPGAARRLQSRSALPSGLEKYVPLPMRDADAFRRIRFIRGSAADLPLETGSVDLVFSVLALEQMEQIRERALGEMARVAGAHTFMIEPFRDLNDSGWCRRYVVGRDYFQGRVDDLPGYGLRPVLALNDFPQEAFLKAGAVLSERDAPR